MTTIVACRSTLSLACDSRVTTVDPSTEEPVYATRCFKIWKTRKYLVGAAGTDDDITVFKRWLTDTSRRRRWSGDSSFQAVLLSRTKLFYVDDASDLNECQDDYYAIGTGASFALAAMNTMNRLTGVIDVELAVLVGCDHDNFSGPPALVYRWEPIRRRRAPIAPASLPTLEGLPDGRCSNS